MDYIQNLEFTLGGIKNPKVDIRGKKKENITLKLYVDKKEVELISNESINYYYVLKKVGIDKNKDNFDYSAIIPKNSKLIELYVVKNKKEIKIKEIKTNIIKRVFSLFNTGLMYFINSLCLGSSSSSVSIINSVVGVIITSCNLSLEI